MTSRPRHRLTSAVVLATSVAVLTGCGSDLSPDVHPGSAAVIGDDEISLDEVDDLAEDLCHLIEPQLEANQLAWSTAKMRAISLDSLLTDALTHRFADEFDLEPSDSYEQDLRVALQANETDQLSGRDLEVANGFTERALYHSAITAAAGREELGSGNEQELEAKGQELFLAWRDEQDVSVDDRFGTVENISGFPFTAADNGLTVAVSKVARDSASGADDPAYVSELPPSQRCG